jgi:hypothetical protein
LLKRFAVRGFVVGVLVGVLLYALTYATVGAGRGEGLHLWLMTVLWPGARMLMAVQPFSSNAFRVVIFGAAILSNGMLYGLLALPAGIVLTRLGSIRQQRQ